MASRTEMKRVIVRPQVFIPRLPSVEHSSQRCTSLQEMSAVQTWTLWQRMPPRYQLTTKPYEDDAEEFLVSGNNTERTQSPGPIRSPRPVSSGRTTNRQCSRSISFRENFMLSSTGQEHIQSELSNALKQQTSRSFSFPKRNSDYISTYQKQKRVNSARRRLAETPPTAAVPPAQHEDVITPRAHTAPIFPVTNLEVHKDDHTRAADKQSKPNENMSSEFKSRKPNLNARLKHVAEPTKVDFFQFDDTKSVSSVGSDHKSRDSGTKPPKKYIVQDTNRATVYIDNGKVMYFGKSRHDLSQLLKTQSLRADRNSCFLAEIRRDYLKHPKYDRGRTLGSRRSDSDPKRIASERVDYNKRVERILNYYDEGTAAPLTPRSRPSSGSTRAKSPKGSRVKGLSLTPGTAPSRPSSRNASPVPESPDSVSDYIRLNKQLKLHERQWYLRTPGMQHGTNVSEIEKCRCSMCRMELQLALVTGFAAHRGVLTAENTDCKENKTTSTTKRTDISDKRIIKSNESLITSKAPYAIKNNSQKVTFQHPEVDLVAQAQETRFKINCILPEVDEMTVSESGFESARTHDVVSTCHEDLDTDT